MVKKTKGLFEFSDEELINKAEAAYIKFTSTDNLHLENAWLLECIVYLTAWEVRRNLKGDLGLK